MAVTVGNVTVRMMPGAAQRYKRLGVVVLLVVAAAFIAPYAVASDSADPVATDTWTVASGETLWSIAASLTGPGGDVWDTVDAIKRLNATESSTIVAGEQILVPARG